MDLIVEMNKRLLFAFILVVIVIGLLRSQDNQSNVVDSLSSCHSYQLWFDGGVNALPGADGEFYALYNLRLGIGKQYNIYQISGFLELTQYKFQEPDLLFPPFESAKKRSDIACYGMATIYKVFSLGIGFHYTREGNIVLYDRPYRIISQTGDHSYIGVYYLLGLGYPIRIFHSISLPVGIYYRGARNNRYYRSDKQRTYVALQIGFLYNYGE